MPRLSTKTRKRRPRPTDHPRGKNKKDDLLSDEREAAMQEVREKQRKEKVLTDWVTKTALGKKVQSGEVASLDDIFGKGFTILEPEIVDALASDLEEVLVDFSKTTRVTRQGRNFSFRAAVLVGDKNGHVGIGVAKDRERFPAIKKATAAAKLNLIRVVRGSGSWEDTSGISGGHSIPFKTEGACASVKITLLPAPKGVGLVVGNHVKDVVRLAGISDVWSKTRGSSGTKLNFVRAAVDALSQTTKMRLSSEIARKITGGREGRGH